MNTDHASSPVLFRFVLVLTISFIVFLHIYLLIPGVDAGLHMYGSFLVSKGIMPYAHFWNNKPLLIYWIGAIGFISKTDAFLHVRLMELILFGLNLFLIYRVVKFCFIKQPLIYLLTFSALYLVCWDGGFLTETFTIPIILLSVYLLIRKAKYFEFIHAFFIVLCFLLKQNAVIVPLGIMLADVLSNYRLADKKRKLIRYGIGLSVCLLVTLLFLYSKGILGDYIDQVFIYNLKYGSAVSLTTLLKDHFFHNSFLSVKGISFIMILNVSILFTLWKYWKRTKQEFYFGLKEVLLLNSCIIYLAAYWFVYISGKTYPHYFMLLIVPATFILGHYVRVTLAGKIALLALLVPAVMVNIDPVFRESELSANTKQIADHIRDRSSADDRILVAGFGNQYIHVLSGRMSSTKFLMPLFENEGYSAAYKKTISNDLADRPPLFIVKNKNNYKQTDLSNFYTGLIETCLKRYQKVLENDQFILYKRN